MSEHDPLEDVDDPLEDVEPLDWERDDPALEPNPHVDDHIRRAIEYYYRYCGHCWLAICEANGMGTTPREIHATALGETIAEIVPRYAEWPEERIKEHITAYLDALDLEDGRIARTPATIRGDQVWKLEYARDANDKCGQVLGPRAEVESLFAENPKTIRVETRVQNETVTGLFWHNPILIRDDRDSYMDFDFDAIEPVRSQAE
jgi:hypothetical protein